MKNFSNKKRQIMKIKRFNKIFVSVLALLLCAAMEVYAQRGGGGGGGGGRGGGGGGFGGFGGGGGGGGARAGGGNFGGGNSSSGYNNNGTVGSAQITVDPNTHNIIVIADKETTEQIAEVISRLDAPESQVLIRAVFVEVTDSKASDIGAQGSYTGHNGTFSEITGFLTNSYSIQNSTTIANGGTTTTPILTPNITPVQQSFNLGQNFGLPQSLAGAAGNGGIYQLIGSDFTGTIQAIANAGKAQILSRPSILAHDGQMAEIVVGQSIYLPSGVSFTSVGGTATTVPTINGTYENIGIQLDVTPFIGANSLIQMILQPQITSIDVSTPGQQIVGSSLFSGAVFAPNINKRSANTVVVTPDGQTVVIGGLISNQKSSNESKVPILGDIPLFGQLFKFSAKADQKTDLLMFITPHIVQMPSQLAALTAKETGQATMITNSISEQELDRYLERLPVKKK
jgi:general secretion pathway protein D